MKRIAMFVFVVVAVLVTTGRAYAADFVKSVVELPDVGVIVAVHPYSTNEEQEKFHTARQWRHVLPVGVMVRNIGSDAVSVEHIDIVDDGMKNMHVVEVYPQVQSVAHILAEKTVEDDAFKMSAQLDAKYGRTDTHRPIRTNDIFYVRKLEPSTDYYGVVYLDLRNKRFRPIQIKNLEDIDLRVTVIKKNLTNGALARLPLDGKAGFAESLKNHATSQVDPEAERYKFYVGPPEEKPSSRELYEAMGAIESCEAASYGKVNDKQAKSRRKYVTARIDFNRRGEQVAFEIIHPSGSSRLDDHLKSIADNMKHCKMPDADRREKDDAKEPYYSYVTSLGDKAAVTWKPKENGAEK